MLLDGQVLVVALFAVALKLSLWFREEDAVLLDVEPDRKDVLHMDESGMRLPGEAPPEGNKRISARYSSRRLEGNRYV
jgi:hypothetical protein